MGLLDWLTGTRESRASTEPDGFPLVPGNPYAEEHRLIGAAMRELDASSARRMDAVRSTVTGQRIRDLPPEAQCRVVLAALERELWRVARPHVGVDDVGFYVRCAPVELLKMLLRRRLPFTVDDLEGMFGALRSSRAGHALAWLPVRSLLAQVEPHGTGSALPAPLRAELGRLREHLLAAHASAEQREVTGRIEVLLGGAGRVRFDVGERWTDAVAAAIDAVPDAEREAWTALVAHLGGATSTRPSGRWTAEMRRLRDAVGRDAVRARAHEWIAAATSGDQPVSPNNGDVLRGLVWLVADGGGDADAGLLGDLGLAMARKIPNVGMRSVKALNACIAALGGMPGTPPLAQLTRLRAKIKAPQPQALLATTLEDAARRQGMPLADLEELVVPTFGMEEVGVLREPLGELTAEVHVTGTDTVELTWRRGDGRPQKSVPAAVREAHAEALKELKQTVQEMGKMLPAQRDRVEQLFLAERVLPWRAWRERYLDHPLVGPLARRLVWHFAAADGRSALGAWLDGRMVDVDDAPLAWPDDGTEVRLWHPLGFPVDTVRAWRAWLERHARSQPFKQAHREIYLLTDAELATATYSNRFAAHIVRQHQFAALCRARGWRYQLQGWFDSQSTPTLALPRWGLRAELWVEACLDDQQQTMSESGIALYASTDQLRFVSEAGEPVPLSEVPALVFSEVMRDVDLFVAVSSVGADPTWMDRGQRPEWDGYWQGYAFGDLSASAETRREVLGRLLPRLRIASRCTIDGRFLVVRGDLRTYKIHLGSGNILMEPNGQYLCIVPDRSAPARKRGDVWLPFEGDSTLSVIISKAFLLASDTTITDATILRQLHAG